MKGIIRRTRSSGFFKIIYLLMIAVFFLAACETAKPPETATPDNTSSPVITETMTLEPTMTVTSEPTVVPTPEGLGNVPDGYSLLYNHDTRIWRYAEGRGADAFPIPYLTVDSAGAHFALDGASIDIPTADIHDRIVVGQEGALQIYNDTRTGIDYAWDTENNEWVVAAEILSLDSSSPDMLIPIQSIADLENLARLERMVLPPFPENTYFPPLENIVIDYEVIVRGQLLPEFSYHTPLGKLPEGAENPFRMVNYIILEKDEVAGRRVDSYIYTIQVFNPDDGSFSLIHYGGFPDSSIYWGSDIGYGVRFIGDIESYSGIPDQAGYIFYPLPVHRGGTREDLNMFDGMGLFNILDSRYQNYVVENNILFWPEMKALTDRWLTSGHVPEELESIIVSPQAEWWYFPPIQP